MDEEVNLLLLDELLRHQVDVERFKHGHLLQLRAFLQKLMDDVSSQLGQRASDLQQGTRQNQRLTALLRDLTRLSDETADAMADLSRGQLRDLAALEGGYVITAAQLVLPVEVSFATVAPSVIWQTVQDAPMQGRIFDEWFQDYKVAQRNRIIDQVRISVVEGETVDQTIRRIRGTKAAKHEDGVVQGINRRAAEALARTQINHTVTQARQATIGANSEVVSAVTWRSTLDGKTSEVCRARDGKVYPIDKGPRPPAHPNCFPAGSLVTASPTIQAATKRLYNGEMVTLTMASGQKLTLTPNHPVLTRRGWKAAGQVDQSDYLVRHAVGERMASFVKLPHHHMPTRIEDVVESFWKSGKVTASEVPVSTEDFHGDAADGEVAIVWSDSCLSEGFNTTILQSLKDLVLKFRGTELPLLSCLSALYQSFERIYLTAPSPISTAGQPSLIFATSQGHSRDHLFRTSTETPTLLNDDLIDQTVRQRQSLDNPGGANPFIEEFDHVIDISRAWVNGTHVYNLQTEGHIYGVNGYTVHNCRSTIVPVIKSWKELGIDLKEAPVGTRASMNGQVPATETYQTWLKRQSVAFQNEVLGLTKAKLFRDGGLTLDKFVDERLGRGYTLDQLRKRQPGAFAKAGL